MTEPIGVQGGINEYAICANDLINKFDLWGLKDYDFSIYLGVGIAGPRIIIANTARLMREVKKKYKAPSGASNICRLTIVDRVTSDALREASKEYDVIHFFGHGVEDNKKNPEWKQGMPLKDRLIYRTKLAFSDGSIHLSDVFTLDSGVVKTEYMVPWVCFDKYVDLENKSEIKIYPPANNPKPNNSRRFYHSLVLRIKKELKAKKCCEVD